MALKNPFGGSLSQSDMLHERMAWLSRCSGWCTKWLAADKALGVIVLLVVIAGIGKLASGYGLLPGFDFPVTSGNRWQAVFLVNNQVYFGHLKSYNKGYAVLKDVYYLQITQSLQPQNPNQPPVLNLVKLGGELHGPTDVMFLPKSNILFWENMKSDSEVVKAIDSTRK